MKRAALFGLLCLTLRAEQSVFKGFTLIDGARRTPLSGAAMIVDGGRIVWVGSAAQLKIPAAATVTDLTGKYVLPGLMNLHGHVSVVSGLEQNARKFYTRENVAKNLALYASYGVTSVASMGTDQPLVYAIRDEQRRGRPTVSRIFTAGRGFTVKGGYPGTNPGMEGVPYEISTPEEAVRDVDELAAHQPDLVKIWVEDHFGAVPKIPIRLSSAIIQEAHKHGLKVVAHVFYLQDAKELAAAGIDGFAHSVRDKPVDEELIALMKRHGTWQMAATLAREASMFAFAKPSPLLSDPFFTRSIAPDVLATLKSSEYQKKLSADPEMSEYPEFLATAEKNLKRLADAGVRYGFGTDTGPPARFAGYFEHWEAELMVQAGLTPMEVITAATRSAAEFLGAHDLGTVEKGKWADFLVLSANPLSDIRNTRSLESIFIAGNKVR
jgi:imidazolonepropionase-like amidohydrolase